MYSFGHLTVYRINVLIHRIWHCILHDYLPAMIVHEVSHSYRYDTIKIV